ncbi:hypothetical protein [Haladaptatus sp. ZSTT2]
MFTGNSSDFVAAKSMKPKLERKVSSGAFVSIDIEELVLVVA